MEEWEEAMEARPEEERRSGPGKRAAVMQKQTVEHIKPLLRQLKKRVRPGMKVSSAHSLYHLFFSSTDS